MLNAHFVCGDGRCNENIALSAIHQVFHSEHNRLIDDIKNVLTSDASAAVSPRCRRMEAADHREPGRLERRAAVPGGPVRERDGVPAHGFRGVRPKGAAGDPGVPCLLARTSTRRSRPSSPTPSTVSVTRCWTTRLPGPTWTRTGAKTDNSLPLLTAFLNPPAYFNGGAAGTLTPGAGRGQHHHGLVGPGRQRARRVHDRDAAQQPVGIAAGPGDAEPARAREAGIPPLNEVRRQLFGQTNDGQLAPYTSWTDFGQHLKHPESLINFVAAYGTAPDDQDTGPDGMLGTPTTCTSRPSALRPGPSSTRSGGSRGHRRGGRRPAARRHGFHAAPAPGPAEPAASPAPAWTASTCGSAVSPKTPACSAGCWAALSTTCSRASWRTCRTATGSTTWPAPLA